MYYANVEHIQASVVREYVRHFHYSPPLPEDFGLRPAILASG